MEEKMVVGIVGGMGSYATVDLFKRLVDAIPARYEWGRPRILIDNRCSMPSRVRAILYGERREELVEMLAESARHLLDDGATHLVFACNTSHVFLDEVFTLVPEAKAPTLNIIELCAKRMAVQGVASCYLLATEGTIAVGIYQQVFERYGIKIVAPPQEEQTLLREFIEVVKQNAIDTTWQERLLRYIDESGYQDVVLGCTELPVLFGNTSHTLATTRVHDPLEYTIAELAEEWSSLSS